MKLSISPKRLALTQILIAIILGNMIPVYSKILFNSGWTPLPLYFATLMVMSLVLLMHELISLERGERWRMTRADIKGTILSSLSGGVIDPILFFTGIQLVTASESIILTSLAPFFLICLAVPFLRERFTLQMGLGGLFLVGALVTLLWQDITTLTLSAGIPFLVTSSFFAAITTIIHKKYIKHRHLDSVVLIRTLISTVLIGTWIFFTDPGALKMIASPVNPWIFLALPLFGFLAPFFLFFRALRHVTTIETGMLAATGRVIGILIASTVLGEALTIHHSISIILVVLGILFVNVPLTKWRIVPSRLLEMGPLRK